MKQLITLFILTVLYCQAGLAQEREKINWISFEQLSDSLDSNPKSVLINFHTEWCAYCRKMHREVFTDPEIVRIVNENYYAVHFDAESRDTVIFDGQVFLNKEYSGRKKGLHELARLFGDRKGKVTVPITIFLDEEFKVRSRHFEYLSRKKLKELLQQNQ